MLTKREIGIKCRGGRGEGMHGHDHRCVQISKVAVAGAILMRFYAYRKSKQLLKAALPSRTGAEACAGITVSHSRASTASHHARPSCKRERWEQHVQGESTGHRHTVTITPAAACLRHHVLGGQRRHDHSGPMHSKQPWQQRHASQLCSAADLQPKDSNCQQVINLSALSSPWGTFQTRRE